MEIYIVKQGDTIDTIANQYGVTAESISFINQIPYPYALAIGQAVLIDVGENQRTRVASSKGYAYPYISPWVLEQSLPFIDSLLVFSYGFTVEGELLPPIISDEPMREQAAINGRKSVLTLTPFGLDGRFNNNLIHEMLLNDESKERLIQELLETMGIKQFAGIDVDFEFILAEDRDRFTAFVAELRERMNAEGYLVSVALAPKTSADQKGLLYEGKDYRGLGEAANEVLLMTYEWGYKYGPAMAVAPLNKVRQVVEYALTEIPAEKILLGIPNYGYDWTLPFVRGESEAVTIGNVEAIQIAISNNAEIQFDEVAQSPYFTYEKDNKMHEVGFEDVRSLQRKYDLLEEYNLKGTGVWQIMRLYRGMWYLYDSRFVIE